MDIFSKLWHNRVCETRRLCRTIAGAAHQGGCAFEARSLLPSCGSDSSILDKLPCALDAILPAQGQGWVEASAHAGAATTNETPAEARVDRPVKTGIARGGLPDRDVDHPPCRRTDSTTLGHRLSSGACLEDSDRPGLELPETRTTGHPTPPRENSTVAAARLAAYKKKPGDAARIWCSSMKAGLCSFRRCNAPGRRWGGRPCCGTATAGSGSPSSED